MKADFRPALRIILWSVAALLGASVLWAGYLALRYSPEYMIRDNFRNLGTVYDYKFFPERKLTASPSPFSFWRDNSKELQVQDAFTSGLELGSLDAFLEDTGTQAFL